MAARLLVKPKYHRVTEPLLRQWLPRRPREAHKGDFGRLLLLCGATGYTRRACAGGPGSGADGRGVGLCRGAGGGLPYRGGRAAGAYGGTSAL